MYQLNISEERMERTLEVSIDFETRQVSGRDAAYLRSLAKHWPGHGKIYGTQPVQARDPLGNKRDLAVMLEARFYPLPPDLEALLPPGDPVPDDAVS